MTARPVPKRHWRSSGNDPLPLPADALDEPLAAFPSWFMRVTCERCGQERMFADAADRVARGVIGAIDIDQPIRSGSVLCDGMEPHENRPGEPAFRAGCYVELNVFGSPTGNATQVQEGEELPGAPRGFTWRFVVPACC
jgi:hypothetical protein